MSFYIQKEKIFKPAEPSPYTKTAECVCTILTRRT